MSATVRVLELHTVDDLRAELQKIGADSVQQNDLIAQSLGRVVKLENVPALLARFLYQELIMEGGHVVLPPRLDDRSENPVDVLLLGTRYQLQHLAVRIRTQSDSDLNVLADDLERALARFDGRLRGTLVAGPGRFEWGTRTYVMGVLNVTPDSFSGDGVLTTGDTEDTEGNLKRAIERAEQLAAEGADILDVGGESTRPGSQPVSADEELRRVIPVLEALRGKLPIPISIDTYRAEVARAALDAGAHIVNDVWGLRMDPEMKRVVAERGVPIVIMHNRSKPKDAAQSERLGGRYIGVEYRDLLADVIRELRGQIELALDAGIAPDKLIVDPGIGFGKTVEQNLELLDRLGELRVLGFPILLGSSHKSFIGYTLDLPPDRRVEGTAATVALGIARGADIVRVHDVQVMTRVARMTDAILRRK